MRRFVTLQGIAVILMLSLSGCSVLYQPQLADVPLIEQKGDVRLSAQANIWSPAGVSATATAGFAPHAAAQVHCNINASKSFYGHLAAGGFTRVTNHFIIEGYAGLGRGYGMFDKTKESSFSTEGHYFLPYLQFNFGLTNLSRMNFDVGLSMKMGALFPSFDINYSDQPSYHYSHTNRLIEQQLFIRFGSNQVKYFVQVGYSEFNDMMRFIDPHIAWPTNTLDYNDIAVSVGVTFFLRRNSPVHPAAPGGQFNYLPSPIQ